MYERNSPLEQIVESIAASRRYRSVSADFVRSVAGAELGRHHSLKEAIKATKNKLHQAAGAYMQAPIDYAAHLAELRAARDRESLAAACTRAMARHASSRERLPILAEFYAATLGSLPPVRSVLDVACGLNPLAIPWMPLAQGAEYYACDIYHDMMAFVGEFLRLVGMPGEARVCNVIEHCPQQHVDVALLLKAIPCLEQVDPGAATRLLDGLNADHLLVSFPARSLCGKRKGMPETYEAHFMSLMAGRGWAVRRYSFASELAFLVSR